MNFFVLLLPFPIFYLYFIKKKKPNYYQIILQADKHFSLDEELITFWEYKDYDDPYGLMERLRRRLEEKLSHLDLSKAYKFKPSHLLKILSLIFVFLLMLNLINSKDMPKNIAQIWEKKENQERNISRIPEEKLALNDELSKKNIPKEKISQEEYDKEKLKEMEKPKSLEEFLSQYNMDKNTLKKENKKAENQKEEKKEASNKNNNQERGEEGKEQNISNLPSQGAGKSYAYANPYESKDENVSQEEKALNEEGKGSETPSNQERTLQTPTESGKEVDKNAKSGNLPGTEERPDKLGQETQRKVFTGEKIYVPPSQSEELGKNYLFQAPTLEGRRLSQDKSLSYNPSYTKEKAVSSRILPLEFQEILKTYFSQ